MSEVDVDSLEVFHGDLLCGIMLLASPLFIFFGQRLFKGVVCICGGLAAAYGAFLALLMSDTEMSQTATVIILVVSGMVGALLCWKLVLLGFFCLGAAGGVLLSNLTYQLIANAAGNSSDAFHYVIIISFAVVCGSLTICLASRLIKLLTAFSGAYMLIGSVDHFGVKFGWWATSSYDPLNGFFSNDPTQFQCSDSTCKILLAVWLVMFGLGLLVQFQDPECECLFKRGDGRQRKQPGDYEYHPRGISLSTRRRRSSKDRYIFIQNDQQYERLD